MYRKTITFILLLPILITSCGLFSPPTINPNGLSTATPPPPPESGKATIIGQVMHLDGYALTDTVVRLADVARGVEGRGGAYILDVARSPGTLTDDNGRFIFQNLKAGEYVIVIGDIELTAIYEIITESDGQAKVWNLPADQVTDVGILTVNIIPPTPIPTTTPGPYPEPTAYPNP